MHNSKAYNLILPNIYDKINVKKYIIYCKNKIKNFTEENMEKKRADERSIDIRKIPDAPRYFYPVEYIFPGRYDTCAAFEKTDYETGFHIQDFYELCLISKGSGYHIIEDSVIKAVRGDVFIVPPRRKHAFVGGKGFNVYYIHLAPAFIQQNLPRLKTIPAFFTLFEIEPLMRVSGAKYRHLYLEEEVLKEIFHILDTVSKRWQGDETNQLIQESYITVALAILCREYAKMQTSIDKNGDNDLFFMSSLSYILENFNKKITIDELAAMARLSRTSYIKRFHEVTAMSPKQFVLRERIKHAKIMLSATEATITRIAEETGFYDTAHFIKAFTSEVGCSPLQYRRENKK